MSEREQTLTTVRLDYDGIDLELEALDDAPLTLRRLRTPAVDLRFDGPPVPLVEVMSPAVGHAQPVHRLSGTLIGQRLRLRSHRPCDSGHEVELVDEESALAVTLRLTSRHPGTLTATTTVHNEGPESFVLTAVPSLSLPVTARVGDADRGGSTGAESVEVIDARGDWTGEGRWQRRPARDLLADLGLPPGPLPKGSHRWVSTGTWSSADVPPVGVIAVPEHGVALAWQIEHNGAWRAELAEQASWDRDSDSVRTGGTSPGGDSPGGGRPAPAGLVLTLSGPTDVDHGWLTVLAPGGVFTGVPVTIAVDVDPDAVIGRLTGHRRAARRPHPDNARPTLIYNDYMNTLMGDPTTDRLLPLIEQAAGAGAEVFCIDAGWYDDSSGWWDGVGAWLPSTTRFPGGLDEVLDAIRKAGMTPGLWLEPEVVGVRSPVADRLPPEAFFQRAGVRVREAGRYHLDLRHRAARAHLDEVVDRLVDRHGVGYFKLDYNINPGAGTDRDADSVGAGLLGHNRAHLDWLDGVLDRHPGLILENCGSGAMRMDFAMLSRLQLQSTTDQEDPARYAPISVAAPMIMLPEQAGSWAYPSAAMDEEETAYVLSLGLLGRLYLSGFLDRLSGPQRELVASAVGRYKEIRDTIPRRRPIWPTGLPGWDDPWLSLGLVGAEDTLLTVFRRDGASPQTGLHLPQYRGRELAVEVLFPTQLEAWETAWDTTGATLWVIGTGSGLAARTFRLSAG